MTNNDFNVKYNKYLEEGHYGLDINIIEVIDFLDNIFQDFIKIPGFKYTQIKLKFGYCRFYTTLNIELTFAIEYWVNQIIKDNNKMKDNA